MCFKQLRYVFALLAESINAILLLYFYTQPPSAFYLSLLSKMNMATKKKASPKKEDPCWKGYEQVGSKTKKGKKVPNCVPAKKEKKS